MSEYTEQAEQFLKESGLEFRAVLVGDDCPRSCEDAEKMRDMDKVNTFPRRTHIHGKHYRCTISGEGRGHVVFDFWNSYADEEFNALGSKAYRNGETMVKYGSSPRLYSRVDVPRFDPVIHPGHDTGAAHKPPNSLRRGMKIPCAYDLLACIQKYDPGTFNDFCADFGYSDDSMKAFDVYRAVQEEYSKVRRFFTEAELEKLAEIN